MLTNSYAAEIGSRQTHNTYVAESNAYRMIHNARQSQLKTRKSQRRAAHFRDNSSYRLVERLGARLIAIGRALCERRGAVAVEVAYHAGPDAPASRGHSRHVA